MIHYNKRKKANLLRMIRLRREIKYFGLLNYSVSWLRTCGNQKSQIPIFRKSIKEGNPIVAYHTGCYRDCEHERNSKIALELNAVAQ